MKVLSFAYKYFPEFSVHRDYIYLEFYDLNGVWMTEIEQIIKYFARVRN